MGVEPGRTVVRVHVENALSQTGDARADKLASEREDEPVVGERLLTTRGRHRDGLPIQVDAGDLPFHAPNADRAEHAIEADPDRGQVCLVVAHADVVAGVAVDQGHVCRLRAAAKLVELASRARRAPQSGKPASQNEDSLGAYESPPPSPKESIQAVRLPL